MVASANRLIRFLTVFTLLCGVISPALCLTLCSLGIQCAPASAVAAPEVAPQKCPNCPEPPKSDVGIKAVESGDCCCAWIAQKSDPPAVTPPALALAFDNPMALPEEIEVPAVDQSLERTPHCLGNDRAPPGRCIESGQSRAPPILSR